MKLQLRSIGFGLLTAIVVISVVEAFGHMVYPVADNVDFNNKELMKTYISTMPFGALVFVVNAWILGAFVGAIVATRMFAEKAQLNSIIVGILVLAFTLLNMSMIPHPMWMWVSAFLGIIPGAYLGHKIASIKVSNE